MTQTKTIADASSTLAGSTILKEIKMRLNRNRLRRLIKEEYNAALDWLKKGEKIQSNSYLKNLLRIEEAKALLKLGKKDESKHILLSLLEKENISQRHKQLAEELISSNIG